MPAWGIPISPGTDPPNSSKAKQGTAVIAEISHCQHKYTAWTIQPFRAGKAWTMDDSESPFFLLLQPPLFFNYSISLASSSSLQFLWHFSPWFLHHIDKDRAHPKVPCLISPSAMAWWDISGWVQPGWPFPCVWDQNKAGTPNSFGKLRVRLRWLHGPCLCWFSSFSLHMHRQETFPSKVDMYIFINIYKYIQYKI